MEHKIEEETRMEDDDLSNGHATPLKTYHYNYEKRMNFEVVKVEHATILQIAEDKKTITCSPIESDERDNMGVSMNTHIICT